MSSLLQAISQELGGDSLKSIAQAIGAPEDKTQSAISAALPALVGGLAQNAKTDDGAQGLAQALERDHQQPFGDVLGSAASLLGGGGGGGMLGAALGALGGGGQESSGGGGGLGSLLGAAAGLMGDGPGQPPKALDGLGILGHIFGGQQSGVEQGVAKASGLDVSVIKKLLPLLAPLVMSALGSLKKDRNLDAQGVSGLLQEEQQQLSDKSPGGSILDALDKDGDGLGDDLLRIGGGLAQSGLLKSLF